MMVAKVQKIAACLTSISYCKCSNKSKTNPAAVKIFFGEAGCRLITQDPFGSPLGGTNTI